MAGVEQIEPKKPHQARNQGRDGQSGLRTQPDGEKGRHECGQEDEKSRQEKAGVFQGLTGEKGVEQVCVDLYAKGFCISVGL